MYKALFVFLSVVLLPFFANGQCVLNDNNDGCQSYDGCFYVTDSLGSECTECYEGHYNTNALVNQDPDNKTACTVCTDNVLSDGQILLSSAYADGLSYCPWVCDTGYYRSSYNAGTGAGACTRCPYNSTSAQGATDINACTCQSGYYKTTNANGGLINNTFTCQSCTGLTNCNNNATSATVGCPSGSYKTIGTNGVVTCRSCGDYAFVLDNECVCMGNTYGNPPYQGCTKCPAGMLTVVDTPVETAIHNPNFQGEPGATDKSKCKIGAFTKFCNGNGTHCMRLMQ